MVTMTDVLIEERHGNVLVLSMNRPERLHALNRMLNSALVGAIERANADPSLRVIILTGSGDRAFCAGADMKETSSPETAPELPADAPRGNASTSVANSPLPIIAAVNGVCYGGGARLAIQADLRLASDNATFRIPGAEYGLVVAAATLPRLVGAAKAKELLFTTKKIDAAEALACGLVTAVYPQAELLPAALEMAQIIAGYSADAVRDAKRVIDAATLNDDAKALEEQVNSKLRGSPEQTERFRDATQRITGH